MLLNWNTIDSCFLSSGIHARSLFVFFLACLGSFLLVIYLEFLCRLQREFDGHLRARQSFLGEKEYVLPEEMKEKLLDTEFEENGVRAKQKQGIGAIVSEQILRGLIHVVQFSVSYCIMLLFMYSNGMYRRIVFEPLRADEVLIFYRIYHHFYSTRSSGRVFSLYE
jgi:copper transporter 1